MLLADQPHGFDVALEILFMRLFSDRTAKRPHEPAILELSRELLQRISFHRNNKRGDDRLAGVVRASLVDQDAAPIAAAVATKLKEAVATHETYSFENDDLLAALLQVQPVGVLDALFEGDEGSQQAGVAVFTHLGSNPADAILCETLIGWCNSDPERRYPLAASIITFAHRPAAAGSLVWTEQAQALISRAPNPERVLEELIKRFRPMSWSGSRAALIEANARLLDGVEVLVPTALMPFVNEAKRQLELQIASERLWESNEDRARDERFE